MQEGQAGLAGHVGLASVVVPVYNVEKYLDRCVKSIVNQSYRNLEIILVDDGSTDSCPEKCDEWAKKDRRIKVVHKKNAGLGMARNTGIENVTGDYIFFVDSDDYIALDTVEECCRLAKKENADIVSYGFCKVRADGTTGKSFVPKPKIYIYEGAEVQDEFLPDLIAPDTKTGYESNLWMSMSGGGYSASLIRRTGWKLVSEREIISEDVYSLLRLYKDVTKVAVLPKPFYFYCENMSSLTHTYRKDRYAQIKKFYDEITKEADRLGYSQKVKERLFYPYLSNTIAAWKMIVKSNESKDKKMKAVRDIVMDEHLQKCVKAADVHKDSLSRRMLVSAIRKKWYHAVYHMVSMKA